MSYNLSTIKKLVTDALTANEFNDFLFDNFPSVFNDTQGQSLPDRRIQLVDHANRHREIPKLLEAIQKCNPKVYEEFQDKLFAEPLQQRPLIKRSSNLGEEDWQTLFAQFSLDDLADLQRAFRRGFKQALGLEFQQAQPKHPPLNELTQIRELLEIYDANDKGPVLAVRFVEFALEQFQRSSEESPRDLTALQDWRDRIADHFNVPVNVFEPSNTSARHAYLLITLEEIGSDVNVYPELHITGAPNPIGFGAKPTTCNINQVVDQISQWISLAEETPEVFQCEEGEVTLELFLPCKQLDEDVATHWNLKDKRGAEVALGTYRRFLVRSSERIRDRKIQRALKQKWEQLETCVKERRACNNFYLQEDCPEEKGALCAFLKDADATGLKLVAKLPTDPNKRADLLYDIIDAAIPIALWPSAVAEVEVNSLSAEFDALLAQAHLTNFTDLAKQWRRRRMNTKFPLAKHIRLLCDRPDRLPKLPDPNQEDDLLVAS